MYVVYNGCVLQVKSGFALEEDLKVITRQIRDRVAGVIRERDRKQQEAVNSQQRDQKDTDASTTDVPPSLNAAQLGMLSSY